MRSKPFRGVTRAGAWASLCVGIATLIVAGHAFAQHPFWTFEVVEVVDEDRGTHTIRLSPAPPGIHYPRTCVELVIRSRYRRGVGVGPQLTTLFTPQAYDKAIKKLRQAQIQNELVRLGSLQLGFGKIEDAHECEVASNGLAILTYATGLPAVYSVY